MELVDRASRFDLKYEVSWSSGDRVVTTVLVLRSPPGGADARSLGQNGARDDVEEMGRARRERGSPASQPSADIKPNRSAPLKSCFGKNFLLRNFDVERVPVAASNILLTESPYALGARAATVTLRSGASGCMATWGP